MNKLNLTLWLAVAGYLGYRDLPAYFVQPAQPTAVAAVAPTPTKPFGLTYRQRYLRSRDHCWHKQPYQAKRWCVAVAEMIAAEITETP